MKQGWEIKKLGEVVDVLDNLRKPITKKDRIDGDYPYYGATGILSYINNFIFSEKLVLIGEDGAKWSSGENTAFIAEGKYWVNNHAHVIRPNRKRIIDEWIVYYLNFSDLLPFITGMTVLKLNQEKLRSIPIPLPPLSEQKRIVAILDESFAAIDKAKANAEQNLKNAKELFESYLQRVFEKKGEDWEEKRLGEIAFVKSGGTPLRSKKEYWSGNIAWYSSGELNDIYTIGSERKINELAIENSNAKLFPKGSLLIGMYDTAALKMSILHQEGTFNQAIAGVKPNNKVEMLYILHSINSQKPELLEQRRGTRQKNLSLEKIKDINISLPPIKIQQTIVRQLNTLRAETQKLEAIYQKKLEDLEELKKSILQKAFKGELVSEILEIV